MQDWLIAILILGGIILVVILLKFFKKNPKKNWLFFKHTDSYNGNDRTGFWAQHKSSGFKTAKFESLKKLVDYLRGLK